MDKVLFFCEMKTEMENSFIGRRGFYFVLLCIVQSQTTHTHTFKATKLFVSGDLFTHHFFLPLSSLLSCNVDISKVNVNMEIMSERNEMMLMLMSDYMVFDIRDR